MSAPPFTEQQQAAVSHRDGPLLLAANAGAGKTSVLVERFVRLATEDGIDPARILAITFTDKAAGELRARLRARFQDLGQRALAVASEGAWVSTIHGFCGRVLRQHAIAAGLDPRFRVLDESEARALRAEAFDTALAAFLADGRPDALDLVAGYTPDRIARIVGETHDLLRSRGMTRPALPAAAAVAEPDPAPLAAAAAAAAAFLATAGDGVSVSKARAAIERRAAFKPGNTGVLKQQPCADYLRELDAYTAAVRDIAAAAAVTMIDELLGRFADAYAAGKRAASALDYDDLELLCRDLLTREPAIRDAYGERFERIMVDEFQDTNPLQLDLLRLLDRGQTFMVGDELQSIYGFRHADVEVFRAERRRLAAAGAALTLPENFRTDPEILSALNLAFAPIHGHDFVPLEHGRARSRPWSGPRVELLLTAMDGWEDGAVSGGLPTATAWRHAEARLVAQRVRDLVDKGTFAARDVAVLLRASTDIGVYERALEDQGLATLATGGRGFWARRQVLDLLAYLAALANPRDEQALFSLLACPLVGLSADGLARLATLAPKGTRWELLERDPRALIDGLPAAAAAALREFRAWFADERALALRLGLDELLDRAITQRGYDLHVLRLPGGRRRLANMHKLQRLAAAFEARRGRDVRGFIDHATAELEAESREPDAPVELGDADAVRLMTMHAAKGLEFPVVVLADLGRPANASTPDLMADERGVGLRLLTLDGCRANALDYERLKDERHVRERHEDERVHYVAMTRAEELLVVSGAVRLGSWPALGPAAPAIAWVAPALVPDVHARLEGPPDQEVTSTLNGFAARVRLLRNTPADLGTILREAVPGAGTAGEQLALDVPAAGEPAAAAARPAAQNGSAPAGAAPPAVPPPPPPRLSYSSLADYTACPYRYYLQRVLRLPDEDPGAAAAAAPEVAGMDLLLRGTLVHELLETLDPSAPMTPAPEDVRALGAAHDTDLGDDEVADVQRLVQAFIDGPLLPRLAAARTLRREHTFAFALGDAGTHAPLVTGIVDAIATDADGATLVLDYKTDEVSPDEDLGARVERDYGTQRRIYALAALRAGASRVEVVHLFLQRPADPAVAVFGPDDVGRLEAEVRATAAGLLGRDFTPTATPHRGLCLTCPGRRALCHHPEELTLREGVPSPPSPARH